MYREKTNYISIYLSIYISIVVKGHDEMLLIRQTNVGIDSVMKLVCQPEYVFVCHILLLGWGRACVCVCNRYREEDMHLNRSCETHRLADESRRT